MRATPETITREATATRGESGSPATAAPTTRATTGFTNAYVPTSVGLATRSSHMYAVNPTSDEMPTI